MKTITILILALLLISVNSITAQDIKKIEKQQREVLVYPNPLVGQKFTVKSTMAISKVEVINVLGKTLKIKNSENSNVNKLMVFLDQPKQGMYLVKVTFNDKIFVIRKLLVKKQ